MLPSFVHYHKLYSEKINEDISFVKGINFTPLLSKLKGGAETLALPPSVSLPMQ
jgi:hypothetical protein